MLRLRPLAICLAVAALALACAPARGGTLFSGGSLWTAATRATPLPSARHQQLSDIQHLIFIVQENRSFDHYFGTYPGADGYPSPLPCLPSTWYPSECFTPYANHADLNHGGQHLHPFQVSMVDGGKMDGFITTREAELQKKGCQPPNMRHGRPQPDLSWVEDDEGMGKPDKCIVDVMGYHDGTDIPNYWAYAQNYVLLDQFYESTESWSLPSHFELVSGWAAQCSQLNPPDVNSCADSWGGIIWGPQNPEPDLWTDITYLLYQNGVTWGVYLDGGQGHQHSRSSVPSTWNPLPGFETVHDDGQLANAGMTQTQFFSDAANGTLPQVTWLFPNTDDSEHPPARVSAGQTYVTTLINAIMASPDWGSSAIFLSWDDSDGFYEQAPPPYLDNQGLGIRVPALLISPYALTGYVDHQICSTDCYLKFIEDVFLGGERMSESGRPDPREDYRDVQPIYGDLANDFNFTRAPRPPLILSPHPMSLLRAGDDPGPPQPKPGIGRPLSHLSRF